MPKKKEEKVEKVQQPKPKEKEPVKPKVEKIRTVDQMTIARLISNKTGLTITEIQEIIETNKDLKVFCGSIYMLGRIFKNML